MKKQNTTKKTLLASALSLILCVAMLIGATFAWFTDNVTSAGNKIVSGELDVELRMWTGAGEDDYVEITDTSKPLFGATSSLAQDDAADTLWEPGKTQVVYLSIKNAGSLDLKYQVALDVKNPADSKNLYEVMQYAITPNAKYGDVQSWANGLDVVLGTNATEAKNVTLAADAEHFFALSVHMDEQAGNEYMNGSVEFDIRVLAAQLASESDSFGSGYDKLATYDEGVYLVDSDTITGTAPQDEPATVSNDDDTFKVSVPAGHTGTITADIDRTNATKSVFEAVAGSGKSLISYDIKVSGQAQGSEVTVDLFLGTNLTHVVMYHNGLEMDKADYDYSPTTGYVTIRTTSFSPFEIAFYQADNVPLAKVTKVNAGTVSATLGMGGAASSYDMDVAYLFEMTQTAEEAKASPYAKYHADYVVKVNNEVAPEAVALLGYYEAYCDDYNDGNWVAMVSSDPVPANTEIRLIELLLNGGSINYEELGQWIPKFRCGAAKLDDSAIGTTLTVELRLYEVTDKADSENNSWNEETGEYVTVCTYTHTFK